MMRRGNDGSKFMLFLLVWAIVLIVFLMVALGVLSAIFDFEIDAVFAMLSSPWGIIAYQLVAFMLPLAVWMAIKGEPIKPNFPSAELDSKNIIILIALSFLFQPFMMMISGISGLFFTNDVAELMYAFQPHPFWLQLIAIAVTPAICEELVFRGYIQSKYSGHTIKKAALINGLFFAIMHLNLQQFAYTFVLGVIFAYLVAYTRSIWAAIIPHFLINGTQVALGRLLFAVQPAYADPQAEEILAAIPISPEVQAIILFGVISLIISPVVIILFMELYKHNKLRFAGESSRLATGVPPVDEFNAMPEWARLHSETPLRNETPEPESEPSYTPPANSSLIDPFAIGVIVIFVVFIALMFF